MSYLEFCGTIFLALLPLFVFILSLGWDLQKQQNETQRKREESENKK